MDQPGIFTSPEVLTALKNSFLIAGSAALICGMLGLLICSVTSVLILAATVNIDVPDRQSGD